MFTWGFEGAGQHLIVSDNVDEGSYQILKRSLAVQALEACFLSQHLLLPSDQA